MKSRHLFCWYFSGPLSLFLLFRFKAQTPGELLDRLLHGRLSALDFATAALRQISLGAADEIAVESLSCAEDYTTSLYSTEFDFKVASTQKQPELTSVTAAIAAAYLITRCHHIFLTRLLTAFSALRQWTNAQQAVQAALTALKIGAPGAEEALLRQLPLVEQACAGTILSLHLLLVVTENCLVSYV